MFKNLLPKEYSFYEYFDKIISINVKMSEEFLLLNEKKEDFAFFSQKMKEMERECDKITHSCVDALHKTFITPIERTDIHALIKKLDDVSDNMYAAANRLVLYDIKELRPDIKQFAEILLESTKELQEAINSLKNSKDSDFIREKCNNVHRLENRADEVLRNSISALFKEGDPLLILKWKEIFERLEKSIDRCEDLAFIIESILIDNA